jgi:hypothetical protein
MALYRKAMSQSVQTSTTATARVTDRPPILEATRSLGLTDRTIARLMNISAVAVNQWAIGTKPIPHVRHLALLFLVTRLTGVVGANFPPQSRYARRAQIARDAATAWAALARDEMNEDTGGVLHAEQVERGYELGQRMLARLEEQ